MFTSEAVMERWQAIGFVERFVGRYGPGIVFIPWCGAANPYLRVSIFALSIPWGSSKTLDGARIRFDGRGYGLRSSEKYQTNLTLILSTEDVRYEWLTKVVAVTDGDFDEKTGRATWNVYVPAGSR